jgi:hypothetical protein
MFLIQILLLLFFLFALLKVVGRFRAGDLSSVGMAGWIVFWVLATTVVLLPDSTSYLAKVVGINRGADLVVYVALVAIFFLVFKLMVKIEILNRDITKLTRKIALDDKNKTLIK